MRRLWQALLGLLLIPLLLLAGYAAYAQIAWRDLSPEWLEARYGDATLQRIHIDGVDIRYRLQGPADRPVVVLIHSHFLDMRMWDAWLPVLSQDYRVLRYDLAGHGLTGPDPGGRYTVARDVELLEGLLTALHIEQLALVGSSLGGNIAFSFSARHPERTRALVLINSGGLKRKTHRNGSQIPGWADALMPLLPPLALHRFLQWMAADPAAVDAPLKTRFVHMWRRSGNRQAELARLRQFATGEPDALLAAVSAPSLILWGADNPQLPVELSLAFADKLRAASTVERKVYPGAGHLLPLERPQASAQDSLNFLRQHIE